MKNGLVLYRTYILDYSNFRTLFKLKLEHTLGQISQECFITFHRAKVGRILAGRFFKGITGNAICRIWSSLLWFFLEPFFPHLLLRNDGQWCNTCQNFSAHQMFLLTERLKGQEISKLLDWTVQFDRMYKIDLNLTMMDLKWNKKWTT